MCRAQAWCQLPFTLPASTLEQCCSREKHVQGREPREAGGRGEARPRGSASQAVDLSLCLAGWGAPDRL